MPPEIINNGSRKLKIDSTISVTEILKVGAIIVAATIFIFQARSDGQYTRERMEEKFKTVTENVQELKSKQSQYEKDITDIKIALTRIATKLNVELNLQKSDGQINN